jgi:hypothetical protein
MSVFADDAAAKLSRRLQAIPEKLRVVAELADADPYPPIVDTRSYRRFSTRQLMIFVAVVAVFLSVARMWHRQSYCQQKAAFHEDMAAFHRGGRPKNMNPGDIARLLAGVRRRPELAVFHSRMKIKWQNAAAHPWLRVDDDPH